MVRHTLTPTLLDGGAVPLERRQVVVEHMSGDGTVATTTREFLTLGGHPVLHRSDTLAYVYRHGANGEYRAGEQSLRMMKARSLGEWKDAMRIGARATSNFTYADRAGNIFYVWVATAPIRPQLLNPPGGYIRNENDSPHYTNMNAIMPHAFNFEVS
jgi:acyl-homoserine-lactone acylase